MKEKPSNPIDIARLALKQLAYSKVPPTPDNFRKVYDDIAGVRSRSSDFIALSKAVDGVLKDAGKSRAKYLNTSKAFQLALDEQDWKSVEQVMHQLLPDMTNDGVPISWGNVLRDFLGQFDVDAKHPDLVKKMDALEKMLTEHDGDPETMLCKLNELIGFWRKGNGNGNLNNTSHAGYQVRQAVDKPIHSKEGVGVSASTIAVLWRDLLIEALELGLLSQFQSEPELARKTRVLLEQARKAETEAEVSKLGTSFQSYWRKLESSGAVQANFNQSLLKLFKLLVENMIELADGDQWMQGQMAMLQEVINKPPSLKTLQEAEARLKALAVRQSALKHSLQEAKSALKQMAVSCIDLLGTIAQNADEHQEKIRHYQHWIEETQDIVELNAILVNLRQDMHQIQADALRTFEELKDSHEKVVAADLLIDRLSLELDQASELACKDFLTGVMNRRGVDDALEREFARSERNNMPVCVALLDIDHFKRINDTLGHDVGDEAIVHLVEVAQRALRPSDQIARYGGEEFLIILPETALEEGVQVLTRVQRELTKDLFMHQNERLLITFSAGVAQRKQNETSDFVIMRADNALYKAKHDGRNRVIGN